MKIALCQINSIAADLEGNITRCLSAINQVLPDQPDLIVLPEMSVCGFHPLDILFDPSFGEALEMANLDFARLNQHHPPVLFGSLNPIPGTSKFHNCAFLAKQGTLELVAQQEFLWDIDIHFDSRWFISGSLRQPLRIDEHTILPFVGKDIFELAEKRVDFPTEKDSQPDLILSLTNQVFTANQTALREKTMKAIPYPLLLVNQVGGFDSLILDGGSFYSHPQQKFYFSFPFFKAHNQTINFPNPDFPAPILLSEEEQWAQAIPLGIYDFFQKNNIQHAFIGLSGGIDSALTAWLTVQAIGKKNLTGLSLPSRFNNPLSTVTAKKLSANLGIQYHEISIDPFYALFKEQLPDLFTKDSVAENIQPRLRTMILMAYVNFYGGLLINTSNKTELTLGYGTLYGDLAGTLSPIGDLTKPQVFSLANWINRKEEIIPSFILNRKPSAELKTGQVDPFDYPVISPELEELVLHNQSNPIMRINEHKRGQFGTILKVSEKTFGLGRIMPITRK